MEDWKQFIREIMGILGDYAISTCAETFMKRNNDTATNDIARLRGTRFVTTPETEQGKRLSENLIKQATGNDQLTARFLYGEYFNFVSTFKIFMASNHKPFIKEAEHGIWRQIKLIPFTTTIADEKQDRYLEQKLKEEKSGILNWLIEGALIIKSCECICLNYYVEINYQINLLGEVINRYNRFFRLFADLKGYCDFFLLQDLTKMN